MNDVVNLIKLDLSNLSLTHLDLISKIKAATKSETKYKPKIGHLILSIFKFIINR